MSPPASPPRGAIPVFTGPEMLTARLAPMLAYFSPPFDSPRHLFELKWDGTRCLLFLDRGTLRLQNRRLEDITWRYPELAGISEDLAARNAILDGELVVLQDGRPSFTLLQQREQVGAPFRVSLLARRLPATYVAFDLLFLDDRPRYLLPLEERRALLQGCLRESPRLVLSRAVPEKGRAFFAGAVAQGFEGVMAKARDSPYLIGIRSRYWLKIKPRLTEECVIIGYTTGRGGRGESFGALLVASPEGGRLVYRGRVGSGFSEALLADLTGRLRALEVEAPPLAGVRVRGARWVNPELRALISYQEKTADGHFRAPVFVRLLG